MKAFDHHLFPLLDSSDDADGRRLLPRCLSLSLSLLSFVSCSLGVPGSGSSTVSSPKIKNSFQRPLFVLFRRFFIALLSAWRWLVRIPAKEFEINAVRYSGADTSELESPLDLAYRCVLPAPLGYAIHRMEVPPVCEPVIEEVATLLDARCIANEVEGTAALWRFQRPAITVVTTLALGLRH